MVKRYNHNYTIYKKYKLDEIKNCLKQSKLPDELVFHEKDYKDSLRRMNILNDLMARDGNKCLHCGKEPTTYALGKDVANRWHMDLYSEESGGLLMYTIDHVFPKSKGGEDTLDNFQILCKVCNEDKGDDLTNEPKVKTKSKRKYKPKYIKNKLESLTQQVTGILSKLKAHDIVNTKKLVGFTVGKTYKINDIKMEVLDGFKPVFQLCLLNDDGVMAEPAFDFFVTASDFYLMNK